MTIEHIWPNAEKYTPICPITLEVGEIYDWDFSDSAQQIHRILTLLDLANLITNPFRSIGEVKITILDLVADIDFGSNALQIFESKHIRVEFRDELMSLEAFIGV